MVEWEWEGQLLKYYDGGEAELRRRFSLTSVTPILVCDSTSQSDRGIRHVA